MNLSLRFMNQFRESKAKIHESKSSFVNLSLRFILFIFVSLFLRFMNLSLKIHDIPLRFMNLIFLRFMNLMWRYGRTKSWQKASQSTKGLRIFPIQPLIFNPGKVLSLD